MDLHVLAATCAHQLEQTGTGLSSSQGSLYFAQPAHHKPYHTLSEVDNEMEFDGPVAGPVAVARSSDSKFAGAITKHTKHRAAEQRRRERINERLQVLRELVPHDTRSNTATFLEGVITYIQNMQQSNAALEAELSGLKAMRAQASYDQQQELLAQPAGSGSNPANSYHQPNQQQKSHLFDSSWRQDSITGVSPHSPEAAMAAAAAAAGGHHWQHALEAAAAGATVPDSKAGGLPVLQQRPRQHAALSAVCATEQRQTLSSSPPLPHAAAAAAAPALSAPAALMHGLLQPRSGSAAAAAAGAGAGGVPAASAGLPSLQPVELQNVLEKALLAALQQQAQQLATQMLSRGN